jgi:protein TonB
VVAYQSDLDKHDKGRAIAAVIAIHAALLFLLLHMSGRIDLQNPQQVLRVFDVNEVPPPPPPPPQLRERPRQKEKEGGSAPKNIRSQATPVVAPKPRIVTPPVQQIVATETPRQGSQPTQGASDVRGPGTGAGGTGTGTGSGYGGNGPGGGGGGVAVPPSLLRGITARDYPPGIMNQWPRGGVVFLRLRVEPDGHPSRCDVMRSFGNPLVDQWTCSLVMERGQFRPAFDARGVPVAAWFGYKQVDVGR